MSPAEATLLTEASREQAQRSLGLRVPELQVGAVSATARPVNVVRAGKHGQRAGHSRPKPLC